MPATRGTLAVAPPARRRAPGLQPGKPFFRVLQAGCRATSLLPTCSVGREQLPPPLQRLGSKHLPPKDPNWSSSGLFLDTRTAVKMRLPTQSAGFQISPAGAETSINVASFRLTSRPGLTSGLSRGRRVQSARRELSRRLEAELQRSSDFAAKQPFLTDRLCQ
jgi:hypothetical protein